MKPLSECRLYAFVDTAYLHGRSPETVARQLCDGGADLIQVRAKGASLDLVSPLARTVRAVTQAADVGLVVNDYLDLAREVGADFCHLGQEDFFGAGFDNIEQLRKGSSVPFIGLSTHGPAQAQRALQAGADYLAIGPVYATATKPAAQPVTLEYVRWAAAHVTVPWFAIGGITLENLDDVIAAGARRICVVSAILSAPDVAKRCREFKEALGRV
ncbi:MAG TPA: thiamine phosphate synthase [Verrucomicrobiae bacterium]|nr:thiamine phosphate synthase [Verrucomicrobiae bacterium]